MTSTAPRYTVSACTETRDGATHWRKVCVTEIQAEAFDIAREHSDLNDCWVSVTNALNCVVEAWECGVRQWVGAHRDAADNAALDAAAGY